MTAIERITKRLAEIEERENYSSEGPYNMQLIKHCSTDIPALRKALELLLAVANTPAGITSIEVLNEKIANILEGKCETR